MKKICRKCNISKEIDTENFYKHPTGKDGFRNTCKNCNSLNYYGKNHQGTITQFNNSRKLSIEFEDNTKLCLECNTRKPIGNFNKDKSILASNCKECQSYIRIYQKYKLTKDDYLELLEKQNYCCKICENKEIYYEKLIVDHSHDTGLVRGLLCSLCNKSLGGFKDNIKYLKSAIDYLSAEF